jgi:ribosomal protein S18 acetylase RimI-like enzyme
MPRAYVDWTIRPATAGDATAVSEVLTAAALAAWGEWLGAERIESATGAVVHPADLVAVDAADRVIGFVSWDSATGEITRLYTHPDAWGSGAGRGLLDRALVALRDAGVSQAWLNTEERNERARHFYEQQGWRIEGEPRVREWHGTTLTEPRYVRDL